MLLFAPMKHTGKHWLGALLLGGALLALSCAGPVQQTGSDPGARAPVIHGEPVTLNPGLSSEEKVVEARFLRQLQDYEQAKDAYEALPDTEAGRVVNADDVRELSADYREDRTRWSTAVHEPASAFVKAYFKDRLANPDLEGDFVLFMAGGAGSGKTTALNSIAADLRAQAHTIFDAVLGSYDSTIKRIAQVREAGKDVELLFVFRPVDLAMRGVVYRAEQSGRVVPVEVVGSGHYGAIDTFLRIYDEHREDDAFRFGVIDASGAVEDIKEADIAFLRSKQYNNRQHAQELAQIALDDEIRKRRQAGNPLEQALIQALGGRE